MTLDSYLGLQALGNMGHNPALLRFIKNAPGNWFVKGEQVLFPDELARWYIKNGFCELLEQYAIVNGRYVLRQDAPSIWPSRDDWLRFAAVAIPILTAAVVVAVIVSR